MTPSSTDSNTSSADPAPAFLADHMLRKLGRLLRLLGFDTTWHPTLDTRDLILRANQEGRIFLTRNHHLPHQHPPPDRALILESDQPAQQLHTVLDTFQLDPEAGFFTRCGQCNTPVEPVADPESIRTRVPPRVFDRHPPFARCPTCGKIYWPGDHLARTRDTYGLPAPGP